MIILQDGEAEMILEVLEEIACYEEGFDSEEAHIEFGDYVARFRKRVENGRGKSF